MTVKRIVPNLPTEDIESLSTFYETLLGLRVVMDLGWIATVASEGPVPPQLSFARKGGSGAPVPDLSIEVDDVDRVHQRALDLGVEITYPLTEEPWGVRRFFARDPEGRVLNILSHSKSSG